MKRILPKIYLQRGTNNWLYFAIGRWQPLAFFGASGWIAPSCKWIAVRFFSELRRHWRMRIASFALPLLLCLLCAPLVGCPSQNTDVLLVQTVGLGVSEYFAAQGNTAAATKSTQLFGILSNDIANLKPGSDASLAEQAGTDVVNFLASEEPNSVPIAELDVAITTVLGVIGDFGVPPSSVPTPAVQAHIQGQPVPHTVAQFKTAWNSIPGNPALLK